MERVSTGWGDLVPVGRQYIRYWETREELLEAYVATFATGLRSGEMVLFSAEPELLFLLLGRLKQEFPDLEERIAARQLVQRLCIQVVQTWKHGGTEELRRLVGRVLAEAKQAGFARVRWIGEMESTLTACTPLDWHRAKQSLDQALQSEAQTPFLAVTFCRTDAPVLPHAHLRVVRSLHKGRVRKDGGALDPVTLGALRFVESLGSFLASTPEMVSMLEQIYRLLACEAGLRNQSATDLVERGMAESGAIRLTQQGRLALVELLIELKARLLSFAVPFDLWRSAGFDMRMLKRLIQRLSEQSDSPAGRNALFSLREQGD